VRLYSKNTKLEQKKEDKRNRPLMEMRALKPGHFSYF